MKADHVRDLTRDEVLHRKTEIEEELYNLRLKKKTKQLDNPIRLRLLRRDLSRVMTILHEDEKGLRALAESKSILSGKKE